MWIPGKPWNTILLFGRIKIEFRFFFFFFYFYLVVPWPTSSHYWGKCLTQAMLITACLQFWPKGNKELCKSGRVNCSLDLVSKHLWGLCLDKNSVPINEPRWSQGWYSVINTCHIFMKWKKPFIGIFSSTHLTFHVVSGWEKNGN